MRSVKSRFRWEQNAFLAVLVCALFAMSQSVFAQTPDKKKPEDKAKAEEKKKADEKQPADEAKPDEKAKPEEGGKPGEAKPEGEKPAGEEPADKAPAEGEEGEKAPAEGEEGEKAPAEGEEGEKAPAEGEGQKAPVEDAGQKKPQLLPIEPLPSAPPPEPPEEKKDQNVEEIVITGTRIGRSNLEEYAHITVLSAKEIGKSGVTTIDELLNKMPSVTLQGINKQYNNGGEGLAFVDLRNLGVGRTLVLVNGRRFVKSGQGRGVAVDMNNIPVQLIDRVEVLLDGASAIYGSDAVGGVINIVLKEDFEGVRLDASTGISTHGDGLENTISGTMGGNFDRGNVTVNLTYVNRREIEQKDRDWARYPVVIEEYTNKEKTKVAQVMGSGTHKATRVFGVVDTVGDPLDVHFTPSGDRNFTKWNNAWDPANPKNTSRYNYGEEQFLVGRMQRFSSTLLGKYEITENAKAYMEGTYTYRISKTQMAPQPLGFGTGVFPGYLPIPISNPYIPEDFRALLDPNQEYLYALRRMGQVGNRMSYNEAHTFRMVAGIKGDFTDAFSGDLYINYGRNHNLETVHNSVNLARAYDTLDPERCKANADKGCVLGNWFGADGLQEEVLDYIRYKEKRTTFWDIFVLGGSVSGSFLDLPGGPIGVAVGSEFRWESGHNYPDALVTGGESGGNLQDATEGDYNAQELFAEVSLPLLKNLPGVHALTVDLAARFSHYNTFGSELTYRFGLSYSPHEIFRLRGIYSTAFRAPSIANLYMGAQDSYLVVDDPCNNWGKIDPSEASDPEQRKAKENIKKHCKAQGVPEDFDQNSLGGSQMRTNVGGNPELGSETAKVINSGIVLTMPKTSPKALRGLSLTFDFYHITVDKAIDSMNPQDIVDRCFESDDLSKEPICNFVSPRHPITKVIPGLDSRLRNIAELTTYGLDITLNWGTPLSVLGMSEGYRFDVNWHGNILLKYRQAFQGNPEPTDFEGQIPSDDGGYPELRWILQLVFSGRNWSVSNRIRYTSAMDIFGVTEEDPTRSVAAMTYWDMVGTYSWNHFDFVFGIDNVIDSDPPFFPGTGQNANVQTHDFVGRYFYAKVGYQF